MKIIQLVEQETGPDTSFGINVKANVARTYL